MQSLCEVLLEKNLSGRLESFFSSTTRLSQAGQGQQNRFGMCLHCGQTWSDALRNLLLLLGLQAKMLQMSGTECTRNSSRGFCTYAGTTTYACISRPFHTQNGGIELYKQSLSRKAYGFMQVNPYPKQPCKPQYLDFGYQERVVVYPQPRVQWIKQCRKVWEVSGARGKFLQIVSKDDFWLLFASGGWGWSTSSRAGGRLGAIVCQWSLLS